MSGWFLHFARVTSQAAGHPAAFTLAVGLVVGWVAGGIARGFSDTYQLYANTFTTIVTFLTMFLLLATQNWDTKTIQEKIDELVRSQPGADDRLVGIEEREGD